MYLNVNSEVAIGYSFLFSEQICYIWKCLNWGCSLVVEPLASMQETLGSILMLKINKQQYYQTNLRTVPS